MATARVEFANLGAVAETGRLNSGVIRNIHDTAYAIDTTDSPAPEVVVPAAFGFAIITAISGNLIVEWDGDGAAQDNGHLIMEGDGAAIQVAEAQTLTFAELT